MANGKAAIQVNFYNRHTKRPMREAHDRAFTLD